MTDREQLTGLSLPELEKWVTALGQPAYRARQILDWLVKGRDFDEMRNLPGAMISLLQEHAVAQPAQIRERHVSKLDGTEKYLFALRDGQCVEGVLMRYSYGLTLCLSTQVGCAMGCAFCASTLQGKIRDLTAGEMAGMAYIANRAAAPDRINHLVLMGSGEPLDNYDAVVKFLRLVSSPDSLNIGLRHISLSTCGLPEKILDLAREKLPVTLSVSLHAPNDRVRSQIMPVARAYGIDSLLSACREYVRITGRRVVFEYALIDGVNAQLAHARELALKLRGLQCHVNLIPLNDVPERALKAAKKADVDRFLLELERLHISATVRRQMGDDIFGACGQLRAYHLKTAPLPQPSGETS